VVAPLLLQLLPPLLPLVVMTIVLFGLSAGIFSLPLQTFIQLRAKSDLRGEILAASSFVNWLGILLAAVLTFLFSGPLKLSAAQGFSLLSLLTLLVSVSSLSSFPAMVRRSRQLLTSWLTGH